MNEVYRINEATIFLNIKAVPGASKTEIAGKVGGRLRIRIAAVPENGKANKELTAFLAKNLACPRKDIVLVSGEKSPFKTLALKKEYGEKLRTLLEKYVWR